MNNTKRTNHRYHKHSVNCTFTAFLLFAFCLELSIQAVNNCKDFISNNVKYFELTQHIEEISLLNNNFNLDIENF